MIGQQESRKTKFEAEILQKLCSNRKKLNFQSLKEWDQKRAVKLTLHRRVADEIDFSLQNRLSESDNFLRVVLQFLQDCEEQKKKYQNHTVASPEQKLRANLVSRNIHRNTSRTLMKLFKTTQNYKDLKKLRTVLEEGVEKIEKILVNCKRDIMEIRTRIELIAVEIQNSNEKTIEKCNQVLSLYNKDKNSKSIQNQIDFFTLQHNFVAEAEKQTEIQKRFGQETVSYLQCAQQYEKVKLFTIKQILEKYMEELNQQNAEKGEKGEGLKYLADILRKKTEEEYIEILYSTEELIREDLIQQIRKLQSKHESQTISIKYIKNFLKQLCFQPIDSQNLLLKEYKVYRKMEEELYDSYLILTVDGFLHVYYLSEEFTLATAAMDFTFQVNSDLQVKGEGDINTRIKFRKWNLLKLGKEDIEELLMVFQNQDQRDQFIQFIVKLKK